MADLGTIVAASPLDANDLNKLAFTNDLDLEVLSRTLGDTPADFGSMDTTLFELQWVNNISVGTDDSIGLEIRVMNGATVLAAADSGGSWTTAKTLSTTTSLTDVTVGPTGFAYVNMTADKATWDGASVELRQRYTQNMAKDGLRIEVDYVRLTGTYTTGVAEESKSGADAGSAAEAVGVVGSAVGVDGPTVVDTSAVTAGLVAAETVSLGESSVLAETATRAAADTGTVTEASVVTEQASVAAADTAGLAEAAEGTATLSAADVGTVAEGAALAGTLGAADTGGLAEAGTVDAGAGAAAKSATDTAGLGETATLTVTLVAADSGATADGGAVTVTVGALDAGTLTSQAGLGVVLVGSDGASAADTAALDTGAVGALSLSASDTATISELSRRFSSEDLTAGPRTAALVASDRTKVYADARGKAVPSGTRTAVTVD